MELMNPSTGTIFWTFVTFGLLFFILTKYAWKPILQTLAEREKRIKESLEAADQAQLAAQKTLAAQSGILEAARKEAQDVLAKARKAADLTKDDILLKANSEAEQMVSKAKHEIELSRDKAMEDIRDLAVDLSMAAATKLIGKSLDKKDHESLVNDSLANIGKLN
jgi:F-type H+-transporting ATPase subunit b